MMNKAQKRMYEVQAITNAYLEIEQLIKRETDEIEWWKENRENFIKELDLPFPEVTDTEHYDKNIEEIEIRVKALEKVLETIYKLM